MSEEFAWSPTPEVVANSRLRRFLDELDCEDLDSLQVRARGDLEWFWSAVIDDIGFDWTRRPTRMHDSSEGIAWTRWWIDGRLNLSVNAVDRHASTAVDKPALIWEGDDGATRTYTYRQLADEVALAAAALRSLSVGPGDAVGLFLPMVPETVVLFLAIARIGAIACPLFSGYGAGAISARLADCDARVLCVADGFLRRGAAVATKATADEAAAAIPTLRAMVVVRRLGDAGTQMRSGRDHWYHELLAGQALGAPAHDTAADDPFMLIYTSGTTGRPKGTVHVHGGFPVKSTQDMAHCFDVGADDRLLWVTDLGWMMGPWAICGTLTLGATLVIYEGTPDHPGPDRLWQVASRHRVTVLGVAPTVVRALMRHGVDPVRSHDLGNLRILGSSGEPWNPDPWLWYLNEVGSGAAPIINYSGGTEVSGGILGGNVLTPALPCSFSGPVPGMDADVVDESGEPIRGEVGELVVRRPWPGMTRGFWRDPQRYIETYWSRFPDIWVHGDWAEIDSNGLWYIRGRSDDTIKVAGKRLGPAEVESVLVAHPAVAEAAAIGVPDPVKGEALVAFVVLRPGVDDEPQLRAALARAVVDELGKALAPKAVEVVGELPRTRNAKVLRRVVRAVYLGKDPGDLSSLENRTAIDALESVRPA
ncbi:MAG TPA: AMP-binding protein [Candidatus Dormibacteraeota bacterium]|nr:AMP-binding protein [Candidatus Dormibacteraeota bacterium]